METLRAAGLAEVVETASAAGMLAALREGVRVHALVLGLRRWMEPLSLVRAERPDLPVLVLSGLREHEIGPVALRAGAAGFAARRRAARDLADAVRHVMAESTPYVSRELAAHMAQAVAEGRDLADLGVLSQLSPREAQTVRLYALGMSRREIADHMAVCAKTVTTFRARAMDKLGLRTNADLVLFAARHGLLDADAARPTARG